VHLDSQVEMHFLHIEEEPSEKPCVPGAIRSIRRGWRGKAIQVRRPQDQVAE